MRYDIGAWWTVLVLDVALSPIFVKADEIENIVAKIESRHWRVFSDSNGIKKRVIAVNVGGKDLKDNDIDLLSRLPDLRIVRIENTAEIGGGAFKKLAKLSRLQELWYRSSKISDDAADGIALLAQLKLLDVANSDYSDETAIRIFKLKTLTSLNVSGNRKLHDASLSKISEMIDLEHLNVSSTSLTDATVASFGGLKNLRHLEMNNVRITDEGIKHLCPLPQIRSIACLQTDVTFRGARALELCLPKGASVSTAGGK